MEVRVRKKQGSRTSRKKASIVVYFEDAVDTTEVASILLKKLELLMIASPEVAMNYATEEPIDPQSLGADLTLLCSPEELQELISSGDFGQGFLLGIYLTQAAAADRLEGSDGTD